MICVYRAMERDGGNIEDARFLGKGMGAMVNPKLRDGLADQLCEAVLVLRNMEECYQFFEDICTIGEMKAMAQRLEVARMLAAGHTYDEIVARTHASTATISRVKRCLDYGADGYQVVLERLSPGAAMPSRPMGGECHE